MGFLMSSKVFCRVNPRFSELERELQGKLNDMVEMQTSELMRHRWCWEHGSRWLRLSRGKNPRGKGVKRLRN